MKTKYTVYIGGGTVIRHHLADVHAFTNIPPKYISEWGRADSILHWIGCVVRPRKRLWSGGVAPAYGIVAEVGRASWLVVLWADGQDPRRHYTGYELDCWHYRGLYDMKQSILRRSVSEGALLGFIQGVDPKELIPTK